MNERSQLGVMTAALAVVFALFPRLSQAELVYENGNQAPLAPVQVQPVPAPQYQVAPAPAPIQPVQAERDPTELTRAELLQRERIRREGRSNDMLQERLEELRIRDESRRRKELIGQSATPAPQAQPEVVVVNQPAPVNPAATAVAAPQAYQTHKSDDDLGDLKVSVSPRGGISNMVDNNGLQIDPRYSVGVAVGLGMGEHFGIEFGYQFSEFGVNPGQQNPFTSGYGNYYNNFAYGQQGAYYNNPYQNGNFETLEMKQNIFEGGLKAHFLPTTSRIRPFGLGGMAYSSSFINYDDQIRQQLRATGFNHLTDDYELTQFLGYVGGGLDFMITRNISVGAQFKYYGVLSSDERSNLNQAAFYGGGYGYGAYSPYAYYNALPDADKRQAGSSLAETSFYSLTGGVTFSF